MTDDLTPEEAACLDEEQQRALSMADGGESSCWNPMYLARQFRRLARECLARQKAEARCTLLEQANTAANGIIGAEADARAEHVARLEALVAKQREALLHDHVDCYGRIPGELDAHLHVCTLCGTEETRTGNECALAEVDALRARIVELEAQQRA